MHGVVAQQVGRGFQRARRVDEHELHVLYPVLEQGARDEPPDPAKAVYAYPKCHPSCPVRDVSLIRGVAHVRRPDRPYRKSCAG